MASELEVAQSGKRKRIADAQIESAVEAMENSAAAGANDVNDGDSDEAATGVIPNPKRQRANSAAGESCPP